VIFDDDGSPDGTVALAYLLANPGVSIRSISISYGEAHPSTYIQHIGRQVDQLGRGAIPLGAGQDSPLSGDNEFPDWLRDSADNFWGLPIPNPDKTYAVRDAAELMVDTINGSPEPVTIFISGPATNLAQALRLDPDIRADIAAVYIMGGAVNVPGNLSDLMSGSGNTVAEWNIYADPLAASEVFASGLEIYLVPLDATNQVSISRNDTRQWHSGGATADFAAGFYEMLLDSWNAQEAAIWDVMTAVIMVNPGLCEFTPLHLQVITAAGNTSGQTVLVPDAEPNVHVCLEPDAARIRQYLIDVFSASP
jgi:purine nucleosidase/pyrimidine-specific ribonucleoside hydrolase